MLMKIVGAIFILLGLVSGALITTFLMIAIGGAMIWMSSAKSKIHDGENEFLSLPFVQRADYKHAFVNSAIAISKAEKKVLLGSGKLVKEYRFDEIKGWEFKSNPHLSVADKVAHGMEYGFFVTVRDIENPVWRIAFNMNDTKSTVEMQRWMEIFDQFVNNA